MKCILHIGTPKTGTSQLQHWLYDNEKKLSVKKIGLSTTATRINNRKLVAMFQEGLDEYMFALGNVTPEAKARYLDGFEAAFDAEMAKLARRHDTVILTSEHFYDRLTDAKAIQGLAAFLRARFDDIKVVCYFREQAVARTSMYSTALKAGAITDISEHRAHLPISDSSHNYLVGFDRWEAAFGAENLVPRVYVRDLLHERDIRRDFMHVMLPEVSLNGLEFKKAALNPSLSAQEAEIVRMINNTVPGRGRKMPNPLRRALVRLLYTPHSFCENAPISDPRQQEIYDAFDEVNVAFFAKYFGEERNMFARPSASTSKTAPPSAEALLTFLKRFMKMPGLVFMTKKEIDTLSDVTDRLFKEGLISHREAVSLMNVAQRARPSEKSLNEKLANLLNRAGE